MAPPFSFHCVICFDKFNEDRHPVVFPCGHTHVCAVCTEKLDACMECNTSLRFPLTQNASMLVDAASDGRASLQKASALDEHRSKHLVRVKNERTKVATPKNVALISLMEAAPYLGVDHFQSNTASEFGDMDFLHRREAEDFDEVKEEKLAVGIPHSISESGTYAVTSREGLHIFPLTTASSGLNIPFTMENEGAAHVVDRCASTSMSSTEFTNTKKDHASMHLECGDRIQVLHIKDGWAKLSLGYGFVRADPSSLVKVGCFNDKACAIEAMLHFLSKKRESLELEENELNGSFASLMNELREILQNVDERNVVSVLPIMPSLKDVEVRPSIGGIDVVLKMRLRKSALPFSMMDSETGCYGGNTANSSCPLVATLASSKSIPVDGQTAVTSGESSDNCQESGPGQMVLTPVRGVCQAPLLPVMPDRPGRIKERRLNPKIDFRTGFSGHKGLSSCCYAHSHESPERRTYIRRMSNHTGLTRTRKMTINPAA